MLVLLVLPLVQILVDHHLSILEDKYLLMHLLSQLRLPIFANMPDLEDDSNVFLNDGIFSGAYDDEDVGAEADFNNMDNTIDVSPIPTTQREGLDIVVCHLEKGNWQKWVLGIRGWRGVKLQLDGIFISQDKYVADILKKFDFCSIKTATTPIVSNKPLVKDEDGVDVDVHVYRSMIGSLMYLTASRPDIMFVVCACARFQVTPKASHLNAVKRTFSDYGGASLDRKSTTGGCQFLGRRLISWQCKKQTIVANSTTEAEYVATANCCGQCCLKAFNYGVDNWIGSKMQFGLDLKFWNTASSQTVNDEKQIYAIFDSKEGALDSRDSLEETNGNEGDQIQIPHDSPLSDGHTYDRTEGALNLQELFVLCTNLSNRVLASESIKDAQAAEISALKSRS
ncbi:hypothetical protein Tco_1387165 [Tanacetum coccineum]